MQQYWIDKQIKDDFGFFTLEGWAIPDDPSNTLQVIVMSPGHKVVDADITFIERSDVALKLLGSGLNTMFGFRVIVDGNKDPETTVNLYAMENEEDHISITLSDAAIAKRKHKAGPQKIIGAVKGFAAAESKSEFIKKLKHDNPKYKDKQYNKWFRKRKATLYTLRMQANAEFPYMPMISLVVPVYKPRPEHLKALVHSVKNQSYQNWQLCLVNGSGEDIETARLVRALTNSDSRIVSARLKENRGISGNTNVGVQMAEGEWVAFADQDDVLENNIFYEYINAINQDETIDAVYCDEDKLDDATGKLFCPNFKPDFNLDLLLCNNYVCHMFMVRQSVLDEAGPLRREYDGAQDHDLILRCSRICRKIEHVSKVLYHWRSHAKSTSQDADSKTYAFDAGAAAVKDYYRSRGIEVVTSRLDTPGFYKTDFVLKKRPLVSVLIPNKDHIDDLEKCIHSFVSLSTYTNYEILIVENNSEDEETFVGYKRLERENTNVRTITYEGEFNYAAINNFAAKEAKGEYLLLLNNDTELKSPDLLEHMLGYMQREEVGIVGPKLLYGDRTIQHAGVLIGVKHSAFHVFLGYAENDYGYMGRARISQNMSGVTGACLLIKKSLWDKLKGMDERFTVAYNDVDLCLAAEKAGYLCVYDAFVKMYHYESKTRGSDLSDANKRRLDRERDHLINKWGKRMDRDPYYNDNLNFDNGYYEL